MYCLKNPAFFFIAFFSLQCYTGMAQAEIFSGVEKRIDSAIALLNNYPMPDSARVNALAVVYTTAVFLKQQKQVKPYCDEALAISRKNGYVQGMAECYLFIGNFFRSSGNTASAFVYFDSLLLITRNEKNTSIPELRAQAFRWKGMIYLMHEDYYEALNNLFEALKYYESHVDRFTLFILTNITDIYTRLNNLDQAAFYAAKNAALAEKTFPGIYKVESYLALVDIYLKKKDLQLASVYLDKAKPYMPDSNETMMNFGYYENRGRINYLRRQYDSSYSYYLLAYKYAQTLDHSISLNTALNFLSINSLKLGKMETAKKYAEENLALAEKTNAKLGKIDALLNLSGYYHQTGNKSKAFDLLQQATDLKDSMFSETNIKQANTLAAIYETDKKQKEILKLQNEKEIQTVSVRQNALLNKIFIATIIGLLVFGYLAYRTIKSGQQIAVQQQEIQKQQISELEKDRQLLTVDAMLKGQEEERGRIAKDLHDGLGGMLSGVKLSFINMKENMVLPAENLSGFEKSIEMLDQTIVELRKVAHNLMPETLVRFGLEESLRDFCNSIQTSTGIKVVYQQFGENRKLAKQAQITIYRIVQELVNNALKHAGAKQIIVQLTKDHIKTGITVEDNGKGFHVKTLDLKKGAGFRNIKDRVDYFKGNLDINSQPGNGTSVTIELKA
ncbi:MAG TPA: sensor histidine kinase [Chitinophagaceae bacterium]|nr:sensor histidine kinase [Chitinophagaceae bacterium]